MTLRSTLSAPGWNFFAWGLHAAPILLFRQILPLEDFAGSFEHVQPAFADATTSEIHDYAPLGKYCTLEEFDRNRCGL